MRIPLGYGQITSLAGPKTLASVTGGIPSDTVFVILQAETQNIRWRDDGTDPTPSTGMRLLTTEHPYDFHGDVPAISFIAETAGAILNVTFYGLV